MKSRSHFSIREVGFIALDVSSNGVHKYSGIVENRMTIIRGLLNVEGCAGVSY
jgi:hypothetical protein